MVSIVVEQGLIPNSGDNVQNTPRCGHPDAYSIEGGRKWEEPPLTYQVRNTVKPYTRKQMWGIVKACLGEWAYWAPRLQFLPVIAKTEKVDLHFEFLSGDHGDGAPFDGPGAVLAHAFLPNPQGEHFLEGDVHFDKDEPWGEWLDLKTVCLHEVGHALGLGHSAVKGAVMYPYYQGIIHQLQGDDAEAIAALYRK